MLVVFVDDAIFCWALKVACAAIPLKAFVMLPRIPVVNATGTEPGFVVVAGFALVACDGVPMQGETAVLGEQVKNIESVQFTPEQGV